MEYFLVTCTDKEYTFCTGKSRDEEYVEYLKSLSTSDLIREFQECFYGELEQWKFTQNMDEKMLSEYKEWVGVTQDTMFDFPFNITK